MEYAVDLPNVMTATNRVFENPIEGCRSLSSTVVQNLNNLKDIGLHEQLNHVVYTIRCQRASNIGLISVQPDNVVRALAYGYGQEDASFKKDCPWGRHYNIDLLIPHGHAEANPLTQPISLFHCDRNAKASYRVKTFTPDRPSIITHGLLALLHKPKWSYQMVPLSAVPIPPDALQRVNILKQSGLFNTFFAIAHKKDVDAHPAYRNYDIAIVATIVDRYTVNPPRPGETIASCTFPTNVRFSHYFVAKC